MKEKSLKDLFHRLGQILPEEQELITVPPDAPARQVLEFMREHNYSQVPVVVGKEVLGVFSHRSFSEGIMRLDKKEQDPAGLPVEAFTEDLKFAQITTELSMLFDEFDMKGAILAGSEVRLQGIITTVDALRYFHSVASPYIMLREIELSVRELMRASVTAEELEICIDKCLRKHYEGKSLKKVPSCLEEMTFSDYRTILKFKGFWEKFKDTFGGSYTMANTKLDPLPSLRNDVFHFRRNLTVEEYDILRDCRDWLLKRIRKLDAKRRIDING